MKKGFTLVELVIVIIIVGILSIVAVPIYKNYTDRAKETEGKALLGSIQTAQKVYFAENNIFYGVGVTAASSNTAELAVDARGNKYYRWYKITSNGSADENAEYTAIVSATSSSNDDGNIKALTMVASSTGTPTITGGYSNN